MERNFIAAFFYPMIEPLDNHAGIRVNH